MVTLKPPALSTKAESILARLAVDRAMGRNALVFDRTGELTEAAFRPRTGDRIVDLAAGLLPGEILMAETFITGGGGQVMFVAPSSSAACMAAAILFDYAAQRALAWSQPAPFAIYADGLAKGDALKHLEKIQEGVQLIA